MTRQQIKEEILGLLRGTGRKGIEQTIGYILGTYFTAHCHSHHRGEGGLARHSLEACRWALSRRGDIPVLGRKDRTQRHVYIIKPSTKDTSMTKNKTFRFTTEITPETEILLSGRSGEPLTMSLADERSSKTVRLDTESVIRLQAFLSDFLQKEEASSPAPVYEPTGRALAVMDGDTLDIIRVFKTSDVVGFAGAETDSYGALCDKVRAIADVRLPERPVFVFFDTFDGSISRSIIRRILRACISYQVDFVRSADPTRCRRMVLGDIEAFTRIDSSVISRATRDVLVLSPAVTFTMKAADADLERPSLFDEGSTTTDGRECSRKAVLSAIRDIIGAEAPTDPVTDEEMAGLLTDMGYAVARRTVSKYRELLGIPKRADRRVRE